jgi:hypothetical protein
MELIDKWDIELSTDCTCRYCETCGIVTDVTICEECKQPTREVEYCDGFCYEYKLEGIDELMEEYSRLNGHEYMRVNGSRMGWMNLEGSTDIIPATGEQLRKVLSINGSYTLKITKDENNLISITRYSHDEPMGATFTVSPADYDEEVA